jgi:uncharacterized protein YjbI with pentapeptide repeats
MTFSENNSLLPGGSVSASEVKKLNEKIDNLSQTVTSVADSVSALSNEVDTSSLNASNAVIDNATIGSETVSSADITDAEIESADITGADITNADITNAEIDEAEITSLTVTNEVAISVNSASFTGQNIHVSDNIQTDKKLLGADVEATNAKFTNAEVTDLEIKDDTTVRGDVYFPENGDKIYGEYLEVDANEIKGKTVKAVNLTTETPSGTNNLVGYDVSTGKLIPVDASLDPTVLWEQDSNDQTIIVPKSNKNVKVPGLAVTGQMAVTNEAYFLDEVTMQDNLGVQGYATIGGDLTVNQDVNTDDLNVTTDATVGGDLDVDGDTTLDDTTVDGTLQVNGDIIQNGSAYETHAEKVYTKNDLIFTRDGAVSALSQGDFTGIQAEKYDGTNDGQLVFDNTGEARVGDVGDTEPLMTRDELANMTDARPLVWDGTNSKAVTGTSGQADALNSGITASDVTKLSGIEAGAQANVQADWDQTDSTADDYIKNKPGLTVDASLDPTSNNSVRNSAICAGLNMGAVCDNGVYTSAKTVSIDGFVLQKGSRVTVMFPANSAVAPTLNVSSTGAKPIKVVKAGAKVTPINHTGYWRGASSTSSEMWQPYTTLELLYDGTDWVIVGNPVIESYEDGAGNGYTVYADGKIEQWGYSSDTTNPCTITLPVAYSNAYYYANVTMVSDSQDTSVYTFYVASIKSKNETTIEVKRNRHRDSNTASSTMPFVYNCIGY